MMEIYYVPAEDHLTPAQTELLVYRALSPWEQQTYNNYRTEMKRREFLTGRLLVKSILSEKYHTSPQRIELLKDQHGKPSCPGSWQFNLSHAQGAVACAFAKGRPVGLDIEYMDPANLYLAEHICTPEQLHYWRSQPARALQVFYELWTRKEAFIKGAGTGFKMEPRQIVVPLGTAADWQNGWMFLETVEVAPSMLMSAVIEQSEENGLAVQNSIHTIAASQLAKRLIMME